jgi:hypothetical protein
MFNRGCFLARKQKYFIIDEILPSHKESKKKYDKEKFFFLIKTKFDVKN